MGVLLDLDVSYLNSYNPHLLVYLWNIGFLQREFGVQGASQVCMHNVIFDLQWHYYKTNL